MSGSLQWRPFAHRPMMGFGAKTDRNREDNMRRTFRTASIVTMMLVMSAMPAFAQTSATEGQYTLAQALRSAWLPLESGLVISAREGTPLSAKYEIDGGTFQLSVYVMKPGAFAEVIVDHDAGTGAKVDEITDGGDRVPAQTQRSGRTRPQ